MVHIMSKNHGLEIVKGFCESTSLHGYGYLSNAASVIQKIFWGITIIIMTSIGIVIAD